MMKRRSLLAMIPATSALLALRAGAKPIAKPPLNDASFAITVQCWTFNKFTVWEAIEKSAEAGAAAVELFPGQKLGGPHGDKAMGPGLGDDVYKSLLEHCAKNGITPLNYGVCGISKDENEARKTFEMAKTLGLYGLTTESTEAMDTLEKLAKEYDVKICFHNHPLGTKLGDPLKTLELIKDRDEHIGFCCDVGHLTTSNWDALEIVKKIAPRIRSFHFKDRVKMGKDVPDVPAGCGIINFFAILDEARKHGFAGNTSIEHENDWNNSVPKVAQYVGYLRAYAQLKA